MRRTFKTTVLLAFAITLIGCQTPMAMKSQVKASPSSPVEIDSLSGGPKKRVLQDTTPPEISNRVSNKNLRFNDAPEFKEVEKGALTVIFRDDVSVRKAGKGQFKSKAPDVANNVTAILSTFGEFDMSDFSAGDPEEAVAADEKQAESYWQTDIPNLKSMYIVRFDADVNIKAAAAKLKALPYVLTAYPTPRASTGATLVSNQSFSTLSGSKPSDPTFAQPESSNWHWFNRHKIFHAWSIMGTRTPYIAVVDDNFDTDAPSSWDRPNYQLDQARAFDANGTLLGSNVKPDSSNSSWSHGTQVACIVGSPRNNSSWTAGIVPEARVVPISIVSWSLTSIAAGIRSSYNTSAWVTNVSMQLGGKPITWDPTMRSAVAYATGLGQTVVIIAGNNFHNLNLDDPQNDAGAIIVGGTVNSGYNWVDSTKFAGDTGAGSSYGQAVHLAACVDINTPSFNAYTNSRAIVTGPGTSLAAPLVAGAAALVRENLVAANPALSSTTIHGLIRENLWGSATITVSSGGEQLGKYLTNNGRGNVRELNLLNALHLASLSNKSPVVRIHNVDDNTWFAKNGNWTGRYNLSSPAGKSSDQIWNLGSDTFNTYYDATAGYDVLSFATDNTTSNRSHGYQVWHNGYIYVNNIGGAAERRQAWLSSTSNSIYPTLGEDNNATDLSWHYVNDYVARY